MIPALYPWGLIATGCVVILLLLAVVANTFRRKLWGRFERYYCSGGGLVPEAPYRDCCRRHDNAYGRRGTYDPGGPLIGRAEADRDMRECLIDSGMPRWWAWIVWAWMRAWFWMLWTKEKAG